MNLSIRLRTLISVMVPLMLLGLILGFYFISARIDDARAEQEAEGQRFAQYLGAASEFNLLSGNRKALQDFVDANTRVSDLVKSMILVDNNGQVIVSAGDRADVQRTLVCFYDKAACERYTTRMFFHKPVVPEGISLSENPELLSEEDLASEEESYGHIAFLYDTRPLEQLQRTLLIDGLLISAAAALVAGLIALVSAEAFARPISNLLSVVKRIQHGDLSARAQMLGGGELRQLEEGINTMAVQVEQANMDLQAKVENATSELLQTLAELRIKNRDLEEARNNAEEASRVKDLFLARMSHELRTPLSSVIGYLRLLEDTEDPDKRREYGEVIDQASSILLTTIDDILDFIRLEDGSIRLERRDFDLHSCLHNLVSMQQPQAQRKQLKMDCHLDDSVPRFIRGDSVRLSQIVTNLLSNAIKFTEVGRVSLTAKGIVASANTLRLQLKVKDTGIGIALDQQKQLFKPFVQAEDSISRRFGGSGLGLSITQKLAQYMNGEVSLVSAPDEGVEVTVTVELQTADSATVEIQNTPVPAAGLNLKVLVVEDNDLNRQLIVTQLQDAGATVEDTATGSEALDILKVKHFDLILMDVHMPGMDGIALASAIHYLGVRCPVYALTANITGSEESQLRSVGVEQILYKPIEESLLCEILSGLARSGPSEVTAPVVPVTTLPAEVSDSIEDPDSDPETTRLVLPTGIEPEAIYEEFHTLLHNVLHYLEEKRWDRLFEDAHKLLGSAQMFTRGQLVTMVLDLENAARDQDEAAVTSNLARVQHELNELIERSGPVTPL
ncbi:response regulator [Pseudomaricurvus alkylphenolicus]|uniref:ATP-binding protein n=1 Tax=Pseudomaricurvus alkylphenolicus TaxID=1306991 RepID=UPI001422CD51|nr:response regulator [Pseudomaricurvus alkylphenolicus]